MDKHRNHSVQTHLRAKHFFPTQQGTTRMQAHECSIALKGKPYNLSIKAQKDPGVLQVTLTGSDGSSYYNDFPPECKPVGPLIERCGEHDIEDWKL